MGSINLNIKTPFLRLKELILFLLACQPLMPYGVLSISIALFIIIEIGFFFRTKKKIKKKHFKYFLGQTFFYSIIILSLAYSQHVEFGLSTIFRSVPLLIFPMASMIKSKIDSKLFYQILTTYVFCSAFLAIYLCTYLIINYEWDYIFSGSLVYHITKSEKFYLDVHPTLTSIHFLISSLIIFDLIKKKKQKSIYWNWILAFLFLIFLFSIIAFASKFIILTYITLIFILGLIYFARTNIKKLFAIILLIILVLLIFQSDTVYNKFYVFIHSLYYDNSKQLLSSTGIRKILFNCSAMLVRDNFLFGYGVGSELIKLESCLKTNGITGIISAHNYFARLWLASGFFAVIALVYSIYSNIKVNYNKSSKIIFIMITLVFIGAMLIEDYLSRAYGIALYGFLNHIFYIYKEKI